MLGLTLSSLAITQNNHVYHWLFLISNLSCCVLSQGQLNSHDLDSDKAHEKPHNSHFTNEPVDRDAVLGQDPRCDEFVYSVLMPTDSLSSDSSSSLLTSFFGIPSIQKRSKEYRFQTPNYPDYFPNDIECIKIISAPSNDQRILLNFRGLFELEPESRCRMEFLEIRDGAFGFSPLFGRFCGRRLPNIGIGLKSTGPFMWLRFRSDSTIAHRGFQAVYRFFHASAIHPVDNVYRYRHRMDLEVGNLWNLDEKFLLDQLVDFPQESQRMPIEVAFDVRAPTDCFLMVHVVNITVPREFAWSCSPNDLLEENTVPRCRAGRPVMAGMKVIKKDFEEPDTVVDPASIIDGHETVFEVYPRKTISAYSPPCPKIRRFCDRSVGIANQPDKKGESDRDFAIRGSRVVIRLIIASPERAPSKQVRETSDLQEAALGITPKNQSRVVREEIQVTKTLAQMPTFHFQITVLKKSKRDTDYPCGDDGWIACDAETCIPKLFWCDRVYNCPQWQDEGTHCDYLPTKTNSGFGKSSLELRKEQEKREAEAEQLAAQKLHLSILATLGLALILITTSCILMTLRRRKKERLRHTIKTKPSGGTSTFHQPTGLNHVQDGSMKKSKEKVRKEHVKENSVKSKTTKREWHGGGSLLQSKPDGQLDLIWNSNDSVNTPLLRPNTTNQSSATKSKPLRSDRMYSAHWNQTVPCDLVFRDTAHKDMTKVHRVGGSLEVTADSPARSRTRIGGTDSPKSHQTAKVSQPATLSFTPLHPTHPIPTKSQHPRSPQSNKEPAAATNYLVNTRSVEPIQPNNRSTGGRWVPGSLSPSKHPKSRLGASSTANSQSRRSLFEPHITVRPMTAAGLNQTTGQHVASCRLLGRTQSWGGGLRLAGVSSWHNGEWEVTHSEDHNERPMEFVSDVTAVSFTAGGIKPSVQVYPLTRETETRIWNETSARHPAYTSMPDVNDTDQIEQYNAHPRSKVMTQDCKPPLAKRPRIVHSTVHGTWVPSSYTVDTDEDISNETPILDEHGSILSGAKMPEIQEDPGHAYQPAEYDTHVGMSSSDRFYEFQTPHSRDSAVGYKIEGTGSVTNTDHSTVQSTDSESNIQRMEAVWQNAMNSRSDTSSGEHEKLIGYRRPVMSHRPNPELGTITDGGVTEVNVFEPARYERFAGRNYRTPMNGEQSTCIYEYEA